MHIEYCESCRTKLTEHAFDTGQAVRIGDQPFCKECRDKVVQAQPPAARSGVRGAAVASRTTPPPTRSTPGRKLETPNTMVVRRSGLNRAVPGEPSKVSGSHPRHSAPHGHPMAGAEQSSSMVMVSVIGVAIGVLLAVIAMIIFLK